MNQTNMVEAEIVHDLPPEINMEIGRIIVAFAKLEHKLTAMIGLILQLEKAEMRLVIKEPRPHERLDTIVDLFLLKGIELRTDTKELRKLLETANSRRDRLAHGLWLKHPTTGELYIRLTKGNWSPEKLPNQEAKIKRSIFPEAHPYGANECQEDLKIIEQSLDGVDALGGELDSLLSSFPDRFRPRLPLINPLGVRKPKES